MISTEVKNCLKQLKKFRDIELQRNLTIAEKIDRDNIVYLLSELFKDE